MRFGLTLGLALLCACDKLSDNPSGDAGKNGRSTDLGLHEEAARIATTQGGVMTVGDQNLALHFPLPIMPQAQVEHVGRIEQPGQPVSLQMVLKAPVPLRRAADFYENAMRSKGLKVHSGQSGKDPNQLMLMGDSTSASATALLDRSSAAEDTNVSLTWTEKLVITPATSTAPTRARQP